MRSGSFVTKFHSMDVAPPKPADSLPPDRFVSDLASTSLAAGLSPSSTSHSAPGAKIDPRFSVILEGSGDAF